MLLPKLLLLLLPGITFSSSEAEAAAERRLGDDAPSSCTTMAPLEVHRHQLLPGLFLSQKITTTSPDTTSASASFLTIRLEYEGHGWLGFGFSPNGNSMVGSTVIIGLPDQPNETGINPNKYYLADKILSGIIPQEPQQQEEEAVVNDDSDPSSSENPSTMVPTPQRATTSTSDTSATATPTAFPSAAVPTTYPSTAAPTTTIPTTRGPSTIVPSPAATTPSDRPTSHTTIPTESPTTAVEQESSSATFSSKPTHWWEDPNWRRELRPAQEHRTLRIEPNASSIQQNASHTILELTRPLLLHTNFSLIPVFHDTEQEFDTVIFAVGRSNQLGYHGTMRGARSMLDESFANCTAASASSSVHDDDGVSGSTWRAAAAAETSTLLAANNNDESPAPTPSSGGAHRRGGSNSYGASWFVVSIHLLLGGLWFFLVVVT